MSLTINSSLAQLINLTICLLLLASISCVTSSVLSSSLPSSSSGSPLTQARSVRSSDLSYSTGMIDDPTASDESAAAAYAAANGDLEGRTKDWLKLKSLVKDMERQRDLSDTNLRLRELLKKNDNKKSMLEKLTRPKYLLSGKRNIGQICLPGTGCEYSDMPREAEAKEFLDVYSPSNPGRRRRRSSP